MQQERRSGRRQEVLLSVELCHPGKQSMACRAHNLAPEGMLLENNQSLLSIGSQVDLQVSWNDRTWYISAFVTHCNSDCIGVMFNQRQLELYKKVTGPLDSYSRQVNRRRFSLPDNVNG
ncbi:MAG: hypothetical protein GY792_10305 [Gammaproteobacteria bacterium]|nr:hypothetical protein [Gammaproteobacteria bacterium]